jgi:[citrate (pro-3S)-lyase] ligase
LFFLFPSLCRIVNPSDWERKYKSNSYRSLFERTTTASDAVFPKKYSLPSIIQQLTSVSCRCFDLQPCIERPHSKGEIFVDKQHICHKGNELIAKYIYECFVFQIYSNKDKIKDLDDVECSAYDTLTKLIRKLYIKDESMNIFLEELKTNGFHENINKSIGSIVMNCNPFTFGHRFLIEKALEEVDYLYIFVVEEDCSDFSFSDRLQMVQVGVSDFENRVKVFPSGKFIISSFSFPEYFSKSEITDVPVDSTADILIFGSIIAYSTNISIRFIGEEPYCNVTKQYNETMKKILPHTGVTVREIERKTLKGIPISASLVRQYINDKKFIKLEQLLPASTLKFLQKKSIIPTPTQYAGFVNRIKSFFQQ